MSEQQTNLFEMAENLLKETTREAQSLKHVNIIIAGKTGVGKSSLINAAFREKLADVGMGRPQTLETELIEKDGMPIRIYDTVGLELTESTKQETINDITGLIREKAETGDEDQYIHMVWYCVLSESARFEEPEQELIDSITSLGIPVILVLTKAFRPKQAQAFAKKIREDCRPHVADIIPLVAHKDEYSDDMPYGVDQLSEKSLSILTEYGKIDEDQRLALTNALSSLPLKHREASLVIRKYTGMAFAAAVTPVPLSDAAVLIPLQITMMAQITIIYGTKLSKSKLQRILISLLGVSGSTMAGRFIVTNLLKLIPGAGTAAGGAIGAATAGILTYALGQTYVYIMDAMMRGELSEDHLESSDFTEYIGRIMKENLAKAKKFGWKSREDISDAPLDTEKPADFTVTSGEVSRDLLPPAKEKQPEKNRNLFQIAGAKVRSLFDRK